MVDELRQKNYIKSLTDDDWGGGGAVTDPGFPPGGGVNPPGRGGNTQFCQILPKTA